jgi:hypothetical protein
MTKTNQKFKITESVYDPFTPVLHISGVDVEEMGDAYTIAEVEQLISRLQDARERMLARKSVLDLEWNPTLWDSME